MNALARRAAARLLHLPVDDPDRRTSRADARAALCIARGVDLDDIDPAGGWDISERAYRTVRDAWEPRAAAAPADQWTRERYEATRALWARLRPDLAGDWPTWGGEGR